MSSAVPLRVLSGFLGSGKTTLLNHLLATAGNRRIGILVNDFGRIGVDGSRIAPYSERLVELNGGQIFCACLSGAFVEALEELSTCDIDTILVESSGLARPAPLGQLASIARQRTNGRIRLAGLVTTVDATRFTRLSSLAAAVREQVVHADLVVINKRDLVDGDRLEEIRLQVREINPRAGLIATAFGTVGWDQLPELAETPRADGTEDGATGDPVVAGTRCDTVQPEVRVLMTSRPLSRAQIEQLLSHMGPVLRAKGSLPAGSGYWDIDVVGSARQIVQISGDEPPAVGSATSGDPFGLTFIDEPGSDLRRRLHDARYELGVDPTSRRNTFVK